MQGRCGDLLRPGERELTERFLALPVQARRLYVRMLTRKGPWFRLEGLRYLEIPDLGEALAGLRGAGFAAAREAAAPEDLLPLARKEEILGLLQDPSHARSMSRMDLAATLLARGGPALGPALAAAVPAAAPLHLDWARLMFLLFFGNGDQDLTDFILADTGRVRFEAYPLDPGGRLHAAAERAEEMAAVPWDVGEERFAHRFLRRLSRNENLAAAWVLTHPPPEPVPEVRLLLPGPRPGTVEQAALEAAGPRGGTGSSARTSCGAPCSAWPFGRCCSPRCPGRSSTGSRRLRRTWRARISSCAAPGWWKPAWPGSPSLGPSPGRCGPPPRPSAASPTCS